jgi:hypothetical protein
VDLRIGFFSLLHLFSLSFHLRGLSLLRGQQSWPDGCPFALAAPGGESVDDTTASKVACLAEPAFHLVEVQSCAITCVVSFRFAATQLTH